MPEQWSRHCSEKLASEMSGEDEEKGLSWLLTGVRLFFSKLLFSNG